MEAWARALEAWAGASEAWVGAQEAWVGKIEFNAIYWNGWIQLFWIEINYFNIFDNLENKGMDETFWLFFIFFAYIKRFKDSEFNGNAFRDHSHLSFLGKYQKNTLILNSIIRSFWPNLLLKRLNSIKIYWIQCQRLLNGWIQCHRLLKRLNSISWIFCRIFWKSEKSGHSEWIFITFAILESLIVGKMKEIKMYIHFFFHK